MNHKVVIEPSQRIFTVEQGESILDAALRHGLNLPYGCRNAVCGSCKGQLLEGQVEYGEFEPEGLTKEEQDRGLILFCRAIPKSDLRISAEEMTTTQGIEIKRLPARVTSLEKIAPDVMKLLLKIPQTERMQFLAGQYIDILLENDRKRSFSIANAPHNDELIELHIRHVEGGGFTDHVFNSMKEKDILRIEGPLGSFFLREESDRPKIFMAGGTGFAPIKGIIEHAFAEGLTQPMALYWGARARVDLYLDELARNWEQHENFTYVPVLSAPDAADQWQGRQGMVHEALCKDYPDMQGIDVYAAGPPPMVQAGKAHFFDQGLPDDRYFYDSFDFAPDAARK
ncbi:MAG: CDP-6-deoxy-delta-3,4-glucoseen reductase [Gammaproteobacteria bacterium]